MSSATPPAPRQARFETWNPVTGCAKISPGCRFCFAERISQRYGTTSLPWTEANVAANVVLHPDRLEAPLHWRKPREVFAGSMTDLFGEAVPEAYLAQVLAVMALACSSHFMIITKRAERMAALLGSAHFWELIGRAAAAYPAAGSIEDILQARLIPNLKLCVTVESDRFVGRVELLRATPAASRAVVAEPLLGPLPSLVFAGFDQIMVGGESGGPPERRLVAPCSARDHAYVPTTCRACRGTGWEPKALAKEWVRDLWVRARAAGIDFSFHQWGGPSGGAGGRVFDGGGD